MDYGESDEGDRIKKVKEDRARLLQSAIRMEVRLRVHDPAGIKAPCQQMECLTGRTLNSEPLSQRN